MADYWSKARIFVRFCMTLAAQGSLKLQDDQIISLFNEIIVMSDYLDDKQTVMDVCNILGFLCRKHKFYEKAIEYQHMQLRLAEMTQDKRRQIDAYANLANVYILSNNNQKALECFEKLRDLLAEAGNKQQEAAVECNLGAFYRQTGQYHKAIQCFVKSLEIYSNIEEIEGVIRVKFNLGRAHTSLGKFHEAVEYFTQSLEMAKKTKDLSWKAENLMELGKSYVQLSEIDKAKQQFEDCLEIALEIGDQELEADVCTQIGKFSLTSSQYDVAIECFLKSLHIALEMDDKERAVQALYNVGIAHISLEKFHEAVEYFTQCLQMTRETKGRSLEGKTLMKLGEAHVQLRENEKAEQHFEDCLVIALERGDKELEADVYIQLGELNVTSNHYQKANDYFKKLLAVAKQTNNASHEKIACSKLAHAHENLKEIADQIIDCCSKYLEVPSQDDREKCRVYLNIAAAYKSTHSWKEALKYCNLALETARQIDYKEVEGIAYEIIGLCIQTQGDLKKSLVYFEKYLEVANCSLDKKHQGRALLNLAAVYESTSENAKAIEYGHKALKVALELNDKMLQASSYGVLGSVYGGQLQDYNKSINYHKHQLDISTDIEFADGQIRACASLGNRFRSLGKYFESIKWHKQSLDLCTKIGDESRGLMLQTNLGILHVLMGQYHKANEYLTKSLEMSREVKDRYHEGLNLANLCSSCVKLGDWGKVDEYSKESLVIAVETGDRSGQALALGYRGICKTELGQYDEALELVEQQICLSEEIDNKESLYTGYTLKGQIHQRMQKFQQAESFFKKAHQISRQTEDKGSEAEILSKLGGLSLEEFTFHLKGGKEQECKNAIKKAIHLFKEALHCWELLFEHIQDQDHFKISMLETFTGIYTNMALAFLTQNNSQEALMVSERGRARALNDLLTLKYGLSKSTNQSQRKPISYEEIQQLALTFSVIFFFIVHQSVFTWLISQEECEEKLQSVFRNTSLAEIVSDAYSVMKVREATCEERFIETEEQRQPAAHLEASTIDVPVDFFGSTFKRCVYDEDISQPLEQLYLQLIAPVIDKMTEHDEIVIIPDGSLYTVPFAALKDPATGSYLSETKCIRLAPSLTSLKTLQNSPADFHSKSCALVIGNPHVGEVMFRGKKIDISNLPGAEREAKKISEFLGVPPILGSLATKETIKHHLRKGVAVVHFAAHGTRDGEIFLAPPPRGNQPRGFKGEEQLPTPFATTQLIGNLPDETDYLLTMKDVQESDVRPQLVVLSCCHSGRGEVKADGVIGMTRAFLAAGARAVVASLWAIADDATMVFMERFYKHLKQRKSASKSLHLAMKDMREMPRYSEPRFWAPFFLIGDDVTVEI